MSKKQLPKGRPAVAGQETVAVAQWPADAVRRRATVDLIPYARNARTHTDRQVAQIAASIREFGFTNPVLVASDNTIIAGHGRVLAAQKLGLETVPAMVAEGWTKAQIRAYVIADNKLALNAGWDEELLQAELAELRGEGFDLDLTGFDAGEVEEALRASVADLDPDVEGKPPDGLDGSQFAVTVECADAAEQERVYNQLTAMGLRARVVAV